MAKFGDVFKGTDVKKTDSRPRSETRWLHYTKLIDNTDQYRKSATEEDIAAFAELIKSAGKVLQDLLVRKSGTDTYEIIAGHHRRLACKYLVEVEGLKEFEFLPCKVENVDDVQAEFQLYATNGFMPKTDAEKLHEIERIKYLLDTYPDQFKQVKGGGRTVEKIARILNMGKTTVGDYVTISRNLGDKGREALEKGNINKSAALALSTLPEKVQEELLVSGRTTAKEIEQHKETKKIKNEPTPKQVKDFYNLYLKKADQNFTSRKELKEYLISEYGKCHAGHIEAGISCDCSPKGIRLCSSDLLTWAEFLDLIDGVIGSDRYERMQDAVDIAGQYAFDDIDMSIDEEIMLDQDEENVLDEDEEEFQSNLEKMYDLAYFLNEQRDKLSCMRTKIAEGAQVPLIVIKRQEYIVQGLEKLAKEEK